MTERLATLAQKHGWLVLGAAWLAVLAGLGLLRFDAFGVTEAGAQALLLNWTVGEQVVNPIVTLGPPDFRAILFIPLGLYWPGSIIAVKIFCALIAFGAALALYRRFSASLTSEVALLGTALLLVGPLTLLQINSIDAGPFLLLCFALGVWADQRHRASGRPLAGWYFIKLFLVAIAVTIHPAGIGLPLALAWDWWRNPIDAQQRKQALLGIGIATALVLAFRFGWYGLTWLSNPFASLNMIFAASVSDEFGATGVLAGSIAAIALGLLLISAGRRIASDFLGRIILVALVTGLPAADPAWAFLGFVLLAYFGVAQLVAINDRATGVTLIRHRGLVAAIFLVVATAFMLADKAYYKINLARALAPQDQMLDTLATELSGASEAVKISSQWPARTMLSTRHPSFPLPPVPEDTRELLPKIKGISYIVFDPYEPRNKALTTAFAENPGVFETVLLEERVVMIRVRENAPKEPATAAEPAMPAGVDPETSSVK